MAGTKGVSIQLDVSGLLEAIDVLSQMPDTVRKTCGLVAAELGKKAQDVVYDETPKDTGTLAKSTKAIKKSNLSYDIVQSATSGPGSGGGRQNKSYFYGRAVRLGSRGGYKIYPRAKKALYWGPKKNSRGLARPIPWVGEPITARHPGIQNPFDYVASSVKRLQPDISSAANRISATVTQEAFKRFRSRKVG